MALLKFRVVQDWTLQTTALVHPDTNEVLGDCTLLTKWENVKDEPHHDRARYTITDVELEADEAVLQAYPWGSTGLRPLCGPEHGNEVPVQMDGKVEG